MFLRSAALSAISGCLLIACARPASAGAFDWLSDAADAVAGAATTVGNGIVDAANTVNHEMSQVHYDPFKLIGREATRGISYIPGASGLRPSTAGLDEAGQDPRMDDEDGDQQQNGDTPDDETSKDMDAGCGGDTSCDDPSAGGPDDVDATDPQSPNGLSTPPQASDPKADDASGDEDGGDDDDPRADTGGPDDESAAADADDDPAAADEPDDDGDGNDDGGDGGDE